MRKKILWYWITRLTVVCILVSATTTIASAEAPSDTWAAKVISVQGDVAVRPRGGTDWTQVALGDTFDAGDQIRVGANSRAGILLSNDAVLRLDQNTTLTFSAVERERSFLLKLIEGAANFFSHRPRSLKVVTPFVNGVVEGTEFFVAVDATAARIDLFAGRIRAENPYGSIILAPGEGARATAGNPPRQTILVRPRDSVQWALYYPPVLVVDPLGLNPDMAQALALARAGASANALRQMDDIDAGNRNAGYYTLHAALLLSVGRVRAAEEDIRRASTLAPDDGSAMALAAIIDVVQNRTAAGLVKARQAVERDPAAPGAHIALSYALQAAFELEAALEAAVEAVNKAPESGLVWARLAELRMSVGALDDGVRAAKRAVDLDPDNAHAHATLGFAHLARIEPDKASDAFQQAIALDSAAPLPRLGLGLARIRSGDLASGRQQIEIAAALDPQNALIRSYLGKAYFDEKRDPMDGEQFAIAKTLDTNDPTPWFYDAIRKQTLNRPVEALQDLQKSIQLNDNRAVYRSRLLLDEDLAARSAGLGRIYNDLAFETQAEREGAASLRVDPTNFSAHRLLADIYAGRQRYEITRVSELLQSQLLQPLICAPIQPQSAESSLIAPESVGSMWASWNEFNPLFTRNRTTFQAAGMAGSNDTWSDEVSVAGLDDRFAYSVGQYHYETNGFRPNNDLQKDIVDAFLQVAITVNTSLQFEYRQKEVDHGDIVLNFDPDDYSDSKQVSREERIPRLGFHHRFAERHHVIGSLIYNQTDYRTSDRVDTGIPGPFGPFVVIDDLKEDTDAYDAEGQYLFRGERMNLIVGTGYHDQNTDKNQIIEVFSGLASINASANDETVDSRHGNGYVYSHLTPLDGIDFTFGLSADKLESGAIEARQINPKFGVVWSPFADLTLRGAAFRTLKRSLVTSQTLEPTQVAGFTQFFDDFFATDAKRYAVGVDHRMTQKIFWGAEMTVTDFDYPFLNTTTGDAIEKKGDQYHHRAYLNWMVAPRLAIGAEYLFDRYKLDDVDSIGSVKDLRTQTIPLTLSWFLTNGLQTKIRGTWVSQRVEHFVSTDLPTETQHEDFFLTDVSVGYRLPKRCGMLSVGVTNLFDEDFNFQDTNFLTANDQDPAYKPERQIFFRVSLRF